MPRGPRRQSASGIYHIMVRGIAQSQIFYDDDEREAMLERLTRYKEQCGFEILAWSLMSNHLHLALSVNRAKEPLATIMKRLLLSYSHFFNKKHDRVGYLFQDRYKSKPIDDESYLLAAVRYIHRNPVEIGEGISFWTSSDAYQGRGRWTALLDGELVLRLFSEDEDEARHAFLTFLQGEECLQSLPEWGFADGGRMRDAQAIELIRAFGNLQDCTKSVHMKKADRDEMIRQCRGKGCSVRQIARLTGLNRGIVEKARP